MWELLVLIVMLGLAIDFIVCEIHREDFYYMLFVVIECTVCESFCPIHNYNNYI